MAQSPNSPFDAVVGASLPVGVVDGIAYYDKLADAIAGGHVCIYLKEASADVDPVTIASSDACQRFQGKDADTTPLSVSVTCRKANVTFEEMNIPSGVTLVVGTEGFCTVRSILVAPGGILDLRGVGNGSAYAEDIRVSAPTTVPILVQGSVILRDFRSFGVGAGVARIIQGDAATTPSLTLINAVITPDTPTTSACIQLSAMASGLSMRGGIITNADNGAIDLKTTDALLEGVEIQGATSATVPLIKIDSQAGVTTKMTIAYCFVRGNGSSLLLDYIGADGDADITLIGGRYRTGKIKAWQNARWTDVDFAGCTIDFQSKTGIVVLGGDMTGATLQNIPTDIVFRSVKGQDDRGYLPGFALGDAPNAHVYNSANQSINDGAWTSLTFDSERQDNDTIHSTASNTSRLTCKTAGTYRITGNMEFAANATGFRYARLLLNGTTEIAITGQTVVGSGGATTLNLSQDYKLAVNDYMELQVIQTSGGALNSNVAANRSPEFSMVRVAA